MIFSRSLLERRAAAINRIEQQRGVCATQYRQLTASTRAWAGSPQSIIQAFLAGVIVDQAQAMLRLPMITHGIFRPLAGGLTSLAKARNFF